MLADASREVKKLDLWDWTIEIWRPQGILCWILGGVPPVVGIAHWKKLQDWDCEDEIWMTPDCGKNGEKATRECQRLDWKKIG